MPFPIESVLNNAVVVAFMALGLGLFALVYRKPALLHCLWVLVLVKLLTPPLVTVAIPVTEWMQAAETSIGEEAAPSDSDQRADADEPTAASGTTQSPSGFVSDTDHKPVDSNINNNKPADARVAESGQSSFGTESQQSTSPTVGGEERAKRFLARVVSAVTTARPSLGRVWIVGSLLWSLLVVVRCYRFRRALRVSVPAPQQLQDDAARLADQFGLRRVPRLWIVPATVPPMLCGVGRRTRLLFPRELLKQLSPEARDSVLLHELAHFYRGDHWIRLLELCCTALFWWHPVVWWARRQIRIHEEECCDSLVVSRLANEGRTYADALVDTIEFLSAARPVLPPAASGIDGVKFMKRRMTLIMSGRTTHSLGRAGRLAVVVMAAILLPFIPTLEQSQSDEVQNVDAITAAPKNDKTNSKRDKSQVPDQSRSTDVSVEERIKIYERAFIAQSEIASMIKAGIEVDVRINSSGQRVAWITFGNAKQIKTGLPVKLINYATLIGRSFTDETVGSVAKLKQLKRLELSNTAISHQGLKTLQKELPDCRIDRIVHISIGYQRTTDGKKTDDMPYVFLNGQMLPLDGYGAKMRARARALIALIDDAELENAIIIIRAERDIPSKTIQKLINTAQQVGYEKFALRAALTTGEGNSANRKPRQTTQHRVEFTSPAKSKDSLLPAIKVKLIANADGSLKSVYLGQRNLGGPPDAFRKLNTEILRIIGRPGNPLAKDLEVEIDADRNLSYPHVIGAVSACTGRIDSKTGKLIRYISKIKFTAARNSEQGAAQDNKLDSAIHRARQFLKSQQQDDGGWPAKIPAYKIGTTALCTFALLKSGSKADDPEVQKALKYLRAAKSELVYEVALQTLALCTAKSKVDRIRIQRCADRLQEAQADAGPHSGGWSYRIQQPQRVDNSNSEMAVWALFEASKAGASVKQETWQRAYQYWKREQKSDGSWGYTTGHAAGTGSMTCSGIASIVICSTQLKQGTAKPDEADAAAVSRGLKWLEGHFGVGRNPGSSSFYLYYLMLLRRAGDLTERDSFNEHAWYRTTAIYLESTSKKTGEWKGIGPESDSILATCFALLFLAPSK